MSLHDLMEATGIGEHPGYRGMHTQRQADGAIPNGAIIVKTNSEEGDATPNGTQGKVLGSLFVDVAGYFYFIEWDTMPTFAVGCIADKIRAVHNEAGTA